MRTVKTSNCKKCDRTMAHAKRNRAPRDLAVHVGRGLCGSCYKQTVRRTPSVKGTRGNAGSQDWSVDEMAIECVLTGRDVRLNMGERREVVRVMTERLHLSAAEIARRTRMSQRTVTRHRSALRAAQLELQAAA